MNGSRCIDGKSPRNSRRHSDGNMLIFACFMLTAFIFVLVIGGSFGSLIFMQNRLRSSADEIALAGARKLNYMDRLGQMNNMICRSRQLVFTSQKQLSEAETHYPQVSLLAQRLHEESREMALELESQRQHLRTISREEATVAMQDKFDKLKNTYPMWLPWLRVEMPSLTEKTFGKIKDIDSNAAQLQNVDELDGWDSTTYISNKPGLKLYKEGVNAKLPPGGDGDLNFKLSSLPTPVDKNINPARILLKKSFIELVGDDLPSATSVKLEIQLSTGLGPQASNKMLAIGTAAATGACPMQ
jgi:hypothetical protein